jgi:hypothetical protein
LITPLSFCHHRKHPEIRSQNRVFQQPARQILKTGLIVAWLGFVGLA